MRRDERRPAARRTQFLRYGAIFGIVLSVSQMPIGVDTSLAADSSVPRHVVALSGGNSGRMLWIDWVEDKPSSVALGSEYSIRFCNSDECRDIDTQALTSSTRDDHIEVLATVTAPNDMGDSPVTARVARGHNPSETDWSMPSKAVLPHETPQLDADPSKPLFDAIVLQQGRTYIDLGFCFNRSDDSQLSWDGSKYVFAAVKPRVTYELAIGDRVVTRGAFPLGGIDAAWWPMCDESYGSQVRIDDLIPGTTYRVSMRLQTDNHPEMTALRDFTTPGGCPAEAPQYPVPELPWSHAVVDANNRFVHHLSWVFSRRSARDRGVWPTYESPGKIFPSSGAYEYLPEIDDWALHLEEATSIGKQELIQFTAFEECAPEQVEMLITTVTNPVTGETSTTSCRVIDGVAMPTRIGDCFLRIITSRRNVTSQGVHTSGATTGGAETRIVPLIVDSIATGTVSRNPLSPTTTVGVSRSAPTTTNSVAKEKTSSPTAATSTVPPSAPSSDQAPNVLLAQPVKTVLARTVGSRVSTSNLMRLIGVKASRTARISLKISRQSFPICALRRGVVILTSNGACAVTVTIGRPKRQPYTHSVLITSTAR